MPPLVLAVALAVLVLAGSDLMRESVIRYAFRRAFEAHGMPPDWGEVLVLTEGNGVARPAVNLTGPDLARGGSYGPSQVSRQTARAWGYLGRMEALNEDPFLAAELSAAMADAGFAERGGSLQGDRYVWNAAADSAYVLGHPSSLEDMLSTWNAGVPSSSNAASAYVARGLHFAAGLGGVA